MRAWMAVVSICELRHTNASEGQRPHVIGTQDNLHRRQVQDDSLQVRLSQVLGIFVLTTLRAGVVPRAVVHAHLAHVLPATVGGLHVVDYLRVEDGRVWIEIALLEAVHDDPGRWWSDLHAWHIHEA